MDVDKHVSLEADWQEHTALGVDVSICDLVILMFLIWWYELPISHRKALRKMTDIPGQVFVDKNFA